MVIKQLCNHKEKWGQLECALVSFGFSHDVQQFVMAVGDDDDDYDAAAAANGNHYDGDIDSLNAARRINSTNDNYIQQYLLIVSPLLLLLLDVVTFLVVELELNRSKSSS